MRKKNRDQLPLSPGPARAPYLGERVYIGDSREQGGEYESM